MSYSKEGGGGGGSVFFISLTEAWNRWRVSKIHSFVSAFAHREVLTDARDRSRISMARPMTLDIWMISIDIHSALETQLLVFLSAKRQIYSARTGTSQVSKMRLTTLDN